MDFKRSTIENSSASDEECEFISNNILTFCTYILLEEYRANWSIWLCNTIEKLIITYPDKVLYCIPFLHRLAIRVGKINVQSRLFSFFLGVYFVHDDLHLQFLALECQCIEQNKQKEIVSRMKRIEILWDILDHKLDYSTNHHYYKYIQQIYPLKDDVNITLESLCLEIYLETQEFHEEENILIEYHGKYIDLHEYNMFRIIHLNERFLDVFSKNNFGIILDQIKENKHNIKNFIKEIRPVINVSKPILRRVFEYTK